MRGVENVKTKDYVKEAMTNRKSSALLILALELFLREKTNFILRYLATRNSRVACTKNLIPGIEVL